jgi:chromosome segregation ATPase
LIKLIKEEADVATLLQSRLTDKRQKLETYLNDYTKQMRDMEKRGSQCCLLLTEYKDERDAIVLEEHPKEKEKIQLLQRIEELEKSGIEPKKRLKFLEGKITELERLSEQSLKTIEIRNDYCTEVKRKLTDYDDALKEISTGGSNKRIKVEPLDK